MHDYLIPAHNNGQFVLEALRSIRAQYPSRALFLRHARILAFDDGSTDKTGQTLDRVAARLANLHVGHGRCNLGPARTRNRLLDWLYGMPVSKSDVVLFVDGDDILSAGHLDCKLALLAREPELDAVGGQIELFYDDGTAAHVVDTFPVDADALAIANLFECHLYGSNTLFRARVFGNRNVRFPEVAESEDWLFSAEQRFKARHVPQVTLRYRRHAHNLTGRPCTPTRTRLRALAHRLGALRLGMVLSNADCNLLDTVGYLSFRQRWASGRIVPADCHMPWFSYLRDRPGAAWYWPQLRPRLDDLFRRMLQHNRRTGAFPQARLATFLQAIRAGAQLELSQQGSNEAAWNARQRVA